VGGICILFPMLKRLKQRALKVSPDVRLFLGAASCFILDGMLISVSMARATYLKKIAVDPEHVTPTLNMGTTIDHFFSISVALFSGIIWFKLGYQYVFVLGALIAVANFFSVLRIKIPARQIDA